jgi:large subunit ribosomal protein L17
LGARVGDNAETALIELVDYNEIYGKGKDEAKEAAKRTRRGGSRKKPVESKAGHSAETKGREAKNPAPAKEGKAVE